MFRSILLSMIGSFLLLHAFAQSNSSQLILPAETGKIPFTWRGDSMFARWEPYAYLMIPVKLKGCPRLFYMQFDTGSPYSMLYKKTMENIHSKYPGLLPESPRKDTLDQFDLLLGSTPVKAKNLLLKNFGEGNIDWDDSTNPVTIGTLGTDLIDGRSLLIDYPKQTMRLGDKITSLSEPVDFVYMFGRILLPATIKEKKTLLFFDSGSSAFGLLTDKATADPLALPGATAVIHKVNSWGRQLSVFTLPSADSIVLAAHKLPLTQVSYMEVSPNNVQAEQMRKMGIGGVTGNILFTKAVLFVDTKKKQFAVWRSDEN